MRELVAVQFNKQCLIKNCRFIIFEILCRCCNFSLCFSLCCFNGERSTIGDNNTGLGELKGNDSVHKSHKRSSYWRTSISWLRFSRSIRSLSSAARLSSYCSVFTRSSSSYRFRCSSSVLETVSSSLIRTCLKLPVLVTNVEF